MPASPTKIKPTHTPVNQIGRRLNEEVQIWPAYSRIKSWAYDGKFPTVIVGNKPAVAEADWPEAKRLILALMQPA